MSKAARERSARERLAAERKRQESRRKQRRLLAIVLGSVVAVAVVVVGTVMIVDHQRKQGRAEVYDGAMAPISRQDDGSIVMAQDGVTRPVVEIFEDFQCPACKQFEDSSGQTIRELAEQGKIRVVYRPFHLFSQQDEPIRGNSLRAAHAALCAPEEQWMSYHRALFRFQPSQGAEGYSPDDLVKWGDDVGITDANFAKCVREQEKKPQVDAMTNYAVQERGVQGTPSVFLDGQELDSAQIMDPAALRSTIEAATASGR